MLRKSANIMRTSFGLFGVSDLFGFFVERTLPDDQIKPVDQIDRACARPADEETHTLTLLLWPSRGRACNYNKGRLMIPSYILLIWLLCLLTSSL
jgi:hypothetical protein